LPRPIRIGLSCQRLAALAMNVAEGGRLVCGPRISPRFSFEFRKEFRRG
jgi:hypothetical protein